MQQNKKHIQHKCALEVIKNVKQKNQTHRCDVEMLKVRNQSDESWERRLIQFESSRWAFASTAVVRTSGRLLNVRIAVLF